MALLAACVERLSSSLIQMSGSHTINKRERVARLIGLHEPGRYRIRVSGRVDPSWADRIDGMDTSVQQTKELETFTELTGVLADQAALQGFIDLVYAHGHVLLGVELLAEDGSRRVEPNRAKEDDQ